MSAYIICFASGLKVLPQSQQDLTTGTSRWTSWTGAVRTRLVCSQTGAPTYLPQHLCRSGKPATNALALSRMFSYLVRTKLESSAGRAEGLVVPGSMPWPSSWVRERVETQGPQGSGSKRLVCRNRAAGRFSAPRGETLLLLPPHIHRHPRERAGMGECGGSAVGARYIVRGKEDATQTVLNINRAQCPWSPKKK